MILTATRTLSLLPYLGSVPADRLGNIIRASGEYPTEATIKGLMTSHISNGNEISFEQFCDMMKEVRGKHSKLSAAAIKAAFQVFDSSGYIKVADLKRILTQFGEKLSEQEVESIITDITVTEDGRIDYSELAMRLTS